ncbi:MAG TPA: hypothetical protein VMW10_11090 [Alphaproteobacteria bacterium]|nr:hypothetical protein [Alphaproteobacteria bacterium]
MKIYYAGSLRPVRERWFFKNQNEPRLVSYYEYSDGFKSSWKELKKIMKEKLNEK